MTEGYHPLSQKLDRRDLLKLMLGSGLMATGIARIACSTNTPDSSRPVSIPPPNRLPPVSTKEIAAAATPTTVRAIAPATFGPTISTQSPEWKEILRPITKEDILKAIDTAPPLYGQFSSRVRELYSDPYPPTVDIEGLSLKVYEPTVKFRANLDSNNIDKQVLIRGWYVIQSDIKASRKRIGKGGDFKILLPHIGDIADKETSILYRIINGAELFSGHLEPQIVLEVPNPMTVSLYRKGVDFVLTNRELILRKEAFSLATCFDYLGSMVKTMRHHNLPYLIPVNDGSQTEILTPIFREVTNQETRFFALHDLCPNILAIKSYKDHPTIIPALLAADPRRKPQYDAILNADFGDDPDQWVKKVYRFLIDNRTLFKEFPQHFGDLDKHP